MNFSSVQEFTEFCDKTFRKLNSCKQCKIYDICLKISNDNDGITYKEHDEKVFQYFRKEKLKKLLS